MSKKDAVEAALTSTLEKIRKKFGATSAVIPGQDDGLSEVREVIPSSIDVIDRYVMALGGSAVGRMTELYSAEGGGKTTFAWTLIGAHTKAGGACIYCDNEQSFDSKRAAVLGVDPDRMILLQPYTLEEATDLMLFTLEAMKPGKKPILMVWDSLGGSPYSNEVGATMEKSVQDDRAVKVGRFCRQAAKLAVDKQAHILVVNQERLMRGVMFGPNTTTPGGKALKFAASLRLQLFSGKSLKAANGTHIGKTITFMAVKTRFSPPFRKAKIRFYYEHGWDNCWSTVNHAKDLGLIDASLKADQEATYQKAVAALGWKNAAPWRLLPPAGGVTDEAEEDAFMGDTSGD